MRDEQRRGMNGHRGWSPASCSQPPGYVSHRKKGVQIDGSPPCSCGPTCTHLHIPQREVESHCSSQGLQVRTQLHRQLNLGTCNTCRPHESPAQYRCMPQIHGATHVGHGEDMHGQQWGEEGHRIGWSFITPHTSWCMFLLHVGRTSAFPLASTELPLLRKIIGYGGRLPSADALPSSLMCSA